VQRRQPRRRPKGRTAPSSPRRETRELNVNRNTISSREQLRLQRTAVHSHQNAEPGCKHGSGDRTIVVRDVCGSSPKNYTLHLDCSGS